MKCSLLTLVLLASLSYLRGQAAPSDGNQPKLAFEVASVRVNKAGITGHRGGAYFSPWKSDHNPLRFRAVDVTLQDLVCRAFDIQPYQLIGQPDWFDLNAYDVEAQSGHPSGLDLQMQMLQVLVAERFQLKVHFEDRLRDVYFLTVSRSGPKARAAEEANGPGVPPRFGSWFVGTAESFAKSLSLTISFYVRSGSEGLPVIDRTGLTGIYDFGLRYPESGTDWEIFCGVLENQLGLQFKKGKAQIRMLVIDHVDAQPSEN